MANADLCGNLGDSPLGALVDGSAAHRQTGLKGYGGEVLGGQFQHGNPHANIDEKDKEKEKASATLP
jgi:hypothetical protein